MFVFSGHLNERNDKKKIGLEPIISTILRTEVSGCKPEETKQLALEDIWHKVKCTVTGEPDTKKPGEFHSEEDGTIYNKTVGNILEYVFGGKREHTRNGSAFTFNVGELREIAGLYDNQRTIVVSLATDKCDGVTVNSVLDESTHEGSNKQIECENKGYSPTTEELPSHRHTPEEIDKFEAELKRRREEQRGE